MLTHDCLERCLIRIAQICFDANDNVTAVICIHFVRSSIMIITGSHFPELIHMHTHYTIRTHMLVSTFDLGQYVDYYFILAPMIWRAARFVYCHVFHMLIAWKCNFSRIYFSISSALPMHCYRTIDFLFGWYEHTRRARIVSSFP